MQVETDTSHCTDTGPLNESESKHFMAQTNPYTHTGNMNDRHLA